MKKRVIGFILVMVMMLSMIASAYADTVPSGAKVYGAGTCTIGFTTSRYISKGNGWNNTINVSSTYVIWDDSWKSWYYENVKGMNGNTVVSEEKSIVTGISSQNGGGAVASGATTDRSYYTPKNSTLALDMNIANNYPKIYLRITKPNATNPYTGTTVANMKVWGHFWK